MGQLGVQLAPSTWPDLERVGLDVESAGAVKDAFDQGLGPDPAEATDLLVTSVVPALWPERGQSGR